MVLNLGKVTALILFSRFVFYYLGLCSLSYQPHGINRLDPWAIPLLGSSVLLASGFFLTLGHHAFILGNKAVC